MSKLSWHLLYMARAYMSLRECWIPDRRKEAQEEVVADLHSCLEQLALRCTEMEAKIDKYKQRAVYHMQLSKKESLPSGINRERARARMYMLDRQRMQAEHDKALRSMHMLQQQIDSIVSSHVDMVIVDAMRGFNATAARMALPQKTMEIERLSESLADRQHEAATLQEAMSGVTFSNVHGGDDEAMSDDVLMRELDELLAEPSAASFAPLAADVQEMETDCLVVPSIPSPPKTTNKQPLITVLSSSTEAAPLLSATT